MKLSEIPEGRYFTVLAPLIVSGGRKGFCATSLIPYRRLYKVLEQNIGLVNAEGICRKQQDSQTLGSFDIEEYAYFSLDSNTEVVTLQGKK